MVWFSHHSGMGESREEALMDSNPTTCNEISEAMGLAPREFRAGVHADQSIGADCLLPETASPCFE